MNILNILSEYKNLNDKLDGIKLELLSDMFPTDITKVDSDILQDYLALALEGIEASKQIDILNIVAHYANHK